MVAISKPSPTSLPKSDPVAVETVLSWFGDAKKKGNQWMTLCPGHADVNPSLGIKEGDNGTPLIKCYAGCDLDRILGAVGKTKADLYIRRDQNPVTVDTVSRVVDTYEYIKNGKPIFRKVRYEPKDFRLERYDNGTWRPGLNSLEPFLYNVDEVLDTDEMILGTEGEKDAETGKRHGWVTTTPPHGAGKGKWLPSYSDTLAGKDICFTYHNDYEGYAFVLEACQSLEGKARNVRIIRFTTLPPKGDLTDYFDLAGGDPQTLKTLENNLGRVAVGTVDSALGLQAITVDELSRLVDDLDPKKVSDTTPLLMGSETNLTFVTSREFAATTTERQEWTVYGITGPGTITELVGKIKAGGKTTLVTHMSDAILTRKPFAGLPTSYCPIVYLTEQGGNSFREALRRANLLDRDDFHILFWANTIGTPWAEVVRAAVDFAASVGAKLLVIDTLGQWAGLRGEAENNAGEALAAVQPLQEAAALNDLGIILIRHERKSGGDVGDSGRGSSAFAGAVDIVLQIKRGEGATSPNIRVLSSLSRYDETPDELVIELTDTGYVSHGTETAVAEADALRKVLGGAPTNEADAMTEDELLTAIEVKRTIGRSALATHMNSGSIVRIGKGKRGDPYRYWRPAPKSLTVVQKVSDTTPVVPSERNALVEHDDFEEGVA